MWSGCHRPGMSGAEDEAEGFAGVFKQAFAVFDCDGGVWPVASLGAGAAGVWTRGAPDCAAVCEAVREGEQDGPCGCRAICEAVQRPSMRYVGVRSVVQQDQQAVHRIRSLAVIQRTALVNQLRGLLAEYGVEIAQGRSQVRRALPGILEDGENGLSAAFRECLGELYEELVRMDERIAGLDHKIERRAQADPQARRLMTIPGIGVMTATALLSAAGDIHAFRNGREFAAWLGLVPRQHSTGGRDRMLGISKRGDRYVRSLLVHGARSVVRRADGKQEDTRRQWLGRLLERRHKNVATVALANRMARTAWALLAHADTYQQDHVPAH